MPAKDSLWVLVYGGGERVVARMLDCLPVCRLEHTTLHGEHVTFVRTRPAVGARRVHRAVLRLYVEHCISVRACLAGADPAAAHLHACMRQARSQGGAGYATHACPPAARAAPAAAPHTRSKLFLVVYGASGPPLEAHMLRGLSVRSIESTLDHHLRYAKVGLHTGALHGTVVLRWHECCAAHRLRPSNLYGYPQVATNTHAEPVLQHPCSKVLAQHRMAGNADWAYSYWPQKKGGAGSPAPGAAGRVGGA